MHLLLLLPLFWLSGTFGLSGPGAVRGQEWDSVTVTCQYGSGWEAYIKYWCRGADWNSCKFVVRTSGSEQEVKNGCVSIRDNHKARAFTVTMKELKREDADTYYCGIEKVGSDPGHKVQVTVDPGLYFSGSLDLTGPGAMTGLEWNSVTVTCQYGSGWETNIKYWCRGADWTCCEFIVRTSGTEQEVKDGRVSIRDDHRARAFTVTMKELKREDTDTYWCGMEQAGVDPRHKVQVTVDPVLASTTISSISSKMSVTPIETDATPTLAIHHTEGRSLLYNIHFLFMIFLKVPLLLGMLSAVLWVNWPLRGPERHWA